MGGGEEMTFDTLVRSTHGTNTQIGKPTATEVPSRAVP